MADISKAIEAIKDSRPPATDRFTYLTIVESHISPELLPALDEILQDAELTQDIGWDLVEMLIPLPGSEACLETIARLGNPREVIIKVLEVLETLRADEGYEGDDEGEEEAAAGQELESFNKKFIILVGMLAILHKRIKTKYPSRFLATSLQTVLKTYQPNPEMTASIANLVHSLSGGRRPPLPTRKSSINVANPDQDGDASKNAPDPESDGGATDLDAPGQEALQQKLLLSFVTCILDAYVNKNNMAWSSRLLEYYSPERLVPGKKTMLQAFREDGELLARDAAVGQLMALTRDLGLSSSTKVFIKSLSEGPIRRDPLAESEDATSVEDIGLSTGGCITLLAYWVFASTIFEADQPKPDIHVFPDHFAILDMYMEDNAQAQIQATPGTVEAIVAIGLWLDANGLIAAAPSSATDPPAIQPDEPTTNFMNYHHLLTLISVYHPALPVRNAASTLAGLIIHADPDETDRLQILEDLLENCMFSQLKACAVTWLREELIAASHPLTAAASGGSAGIFAGSDALDNLQYTVFPDLAALKDLDVAGLLDYWVANSPFVLQAVNFAYFLWAGDKWRHVIPAGTEAAVGERWVQPLWAAAETLEKAGGDVEGPTKADLELLRERLRMLAGTDAFKGLGLAPADAKAA